MEFTIYSGFTRAGAEILTKMKQLKYVHVKVHDIEKTEQIVNYFIMLNFIAGNVPNLTIADFDFKNKLSWWILMKAHGTLFPDKNLTIRQIE
jgi:hypothetical protein